MQDVQPIHIYNTHKVNLPKCSFISSEIMRDLMYFLLFLVLISNFTYKSSVSIKLTFLGIKWLYNLLLPEKAHFRNAARQLLTKNCATLPINSSLHDVIIVSSGCKYVPDTSAHPCAVCALMTHMTGVLIGALKASRPT